MRQVDVVPDKGDRFAHLCASSALPMLSRVDPYTTLVLTPQEMEQFIAEVGSELAREEDPEVAELLKDVLRLARKCTHQPRAEVRLEGD
ncbi:hypothetical protein [Lipingzhangella halophila]|uniref:hypothetical protein n=1 Tax=Lipingzhangella halophila TaxID=1783352 RepID=UPI0016170DD0|nr:hypothetical protein [Lipingzhangella halophila]